MLQITELFPEIYELHKTYGSKDCEPIFGGGQINNPKVCLIFMNPTARNVSANRQWTGLRAPWLGTKNVWMMLSKLGLLKNENLLDQIKVMKPENWTVEFATQLYQELADESIYITNIAKCTQDDARPLSNIVYKEYLPSTLQELEFVNPKFTFCFGNQVSSIILGKSISVSKYLNDEYETLNVNNKTLKIYPTFYPVGQGMRNMARAIDRIQRVLSLL